MNKLKTSLNQHHFAGMSCCEAFLSVLMIVFLYSSCYAGLAEQAKTPPTNVEIFQNLIGKITEEIVSQSKIKATDSISFQIDSSPESWIAEQAIISKLKNDSCSVYKENDVMIQYKNIKVISARYSINYTNLVRDGFWGKKKVTRIASVMIGVETYNKLTKEILFSGLLKKESTDTVFIDDIPNLELSSSPSTHCDLPQETFLDRVVEPFVIIGATGVAIYLFFNIRTK